MSYELRITSGGVTTVTTHPDQDDVADHIQLMGLNTVEEFELVEEPMPSLQEPLYHQPLRF